MHSNVFLPILAVVVLSACQFNGEKESSSESSALVNDPNYSALQSSSDDKAVKPPVLNVHCSAPPPIDDIWKLESIVRKSGLITEGMSQEEKAEAIREYIRNKNAKFLACSKGK